MSPPSPHVALSCAPATEGALRHCAPATEGALRTRALFCGLLAACLTSLLPACGVDDPFPAEADGSFGTVAPGYGRDGGLDGGTSGSDASAGSVGPTIRVRFLHAIPNTGALLVCHDPDGPGPVSPQLLGQPATVLRAEYGTRSATISLPAVGSGTLTLHRELRAGTGTPSFDGGVGSDGGAPADPCGELTREASVSLPIADLPPDAGALLSLLPSLSGSDAVTLLGTGVALAPAAIAESPPAQQAVLRSAFGTRVLIQSDLVLRTEQGFSLSVFHGIPDVPPVDPQLANREVGALRLCITAGTRDSGALPKPPATGIPFRVRTPIGDSFDARLAYDFRVFAQGDFDEQNKDCATTSAMPVAKASFAKFQDGKAYTLALFGAIAPTALCSADDDSIVRATCSPPAAELGAKLVLLED